MSVSEWHPPESYSQEAVQEILYLAISDKKDQGELSREQLWEIAAELEIDQDSLQAAERNWLNLRLEERKREQFNLFRREQFQQRFIRYIVVNSVFILFDILTLGMLSWSKFVLLVWSIVMALDAWKTFQTKGEAYEQAFQRWNIKNEIKASLAGLWNKFKRILET